MFIITQHSTAELLQLVFFIPNVKVSAQPYKKWGKYNTSCKWRILISDKGEGNQFRASRLRT